MIQRCEADDRSWPRMRLTTMDDAPIAAASSARPGLTTLSRTFPRSESCVGPPSAASSTNTSEPHRNPGQHQWPSSGTPQGVQELPPGRVGAPLRRRGDLQGFEHPSDGGRADPVAEFQQLALDPLVPPAVVLGGEPLDQRGDLGADRRPSCPVGAGPLAGDQAAVPAQDGSGVTSRCIRSRVGRSRISAARTARSAQSSRGRELARRSTATSCRSTSSSASLEADDRPSCLAESASRRAGRRRDRAGAGTRMIMMPYG